eukprot:gb/GECG01004204.1/.p1 GENE.gb/GECG01004204.1/~~gb/GECG01004204.1/.p1  ORF type:complete len:174 (+),score=20.54 gb/GECG01004204.1/:1-522(+)
MIRGVFIFNTTGEVRLLRCYEPLKEEQQQRVVRELFSLLSKRPDGVCNFLEGGCLSEWNEEVKVVYRHYATLYFVFVVDQQESELGIVDLIQVFVESLDKYFGHVCELHLIFHTDKVGRAAVTKWKEIQLYHKRCYGIRISVTGTLYFGRDCNGWDGCGNQQLRDLDVGDGNG